MLWMTGDAGGRGPGDDFWYEPALRGWAAGAAGASPMTLSVVFGCVRVLAETVGQLPLIMYRRLEGGGKERALEHPLYRLLALAPNSLQTSLEWREMLQGHLELRGNAYARMQFDGPRIAALWPLHPDRMRVELLEDRNRLKYTYRPHAGGELVLNQDEVLHLRGLESDGFVGLNPIEVQRRTLARAGATEDFGNRVFTNDGVVAGFIEHPNNFKDKETRNNYRSAWREQVRSGGVPILEYGMKYHEVGMKLADAQFIESRKYTDVEICSRIFRVPPHKVGILDRATWANVESQQIEFVTESLLSRLKRWEQRLAQTLLTEEEQETYYFEFLVDGLLRGDSAARGAYFEKALRNRWLVPNEVREIENRNPMPWGNEPLPMPNQSLRGERDDERTAELERSGAQAVVRKETHELRTLSGRLAGAELAVAAAQMYQSELPAFLAQVLAVPAEAARAYCAHSAAAVGAAIAEDRLPALLAEWKSNRVEQLLEIIHA